MKGLGHQITKEEYLRIGRVLRARFHQAGLRNDEIDDLVQETFLHAQEGLDAGRFQVRSHLDTWVVGIGKKRLLKFRDRQRAVKRSTPEVSLDDPVETRVHLALPRAADIDPVERLHVKQVLASLQRLPAKLREPLVLVTNGRSYKEAAATLGISANLVTSRVHQARTKLRKLYARHRSPTSRIPDHARES